MTQKIKINRLITAVVVLFSIIFINIGISLAEDMMDTQAEEYFQSGLEAQKSGDVDSAISSYIKAIYVKPDFVKAHNNLGTAYAQKKEYAKAEEEYNKAISIDQNYSMALKNMAVIYAERKDYEKFYEYWKRATGISVYSPFLIDDEDYGED